MAPTRRPCSGAQREAKRRSSPRVTILFPEQIARALGALDGRRWLRWLGLLRRCGRALLGDGTRAGRGQIELEHQRLCFLGIRARLEPGDEARGELGVA